MIKIIPIVFVLFLLSCGETPHFDKTFSFENKEWDQRVMPTFSFDISDTTKAYDVILTLRVTTSYSFNNLWIFMNSKTPSGINKRDPFQIPISKPDGSWIGTKSGTVVENQLVFQARKFPEIGTYTIGIEQGIVEEKIDEILDIGLRIRERK